MNYFSFNSKIYSAESAVIPVDNRALLFGIGLIETMRYDSGIALWARHYTRLYNSCVYLGMDVDALKEHAILDAITALVEANEIVTPVVVRMQISSTNNGALQTLITLRSLPAADKKIKVGIAQNIIKSFDSVSHLKTSSRIAYEIAASEATKMGWNDALILNQYDCVAESTISNIFWEEDGLLYTPPLTEACIGGIFRQYLLSTNAAIVEAPLTIERLNKATKIYLSNAVRGLYEVELIR